MFLLSACASPSGDSPPPAESAEITPWAYTEPTEDDPAPLSLDALTTGVAEAIAALRGVDPRLPYLAWQEAQAWTDTACPVHTSHNNQDLAEGDCTGSTGTSFYGHLLSQELLGFNVVYNGEEHFHRTFRWLSGAGVLEAADGRRFEAMGDALYRDYDDGDERVLEVYLWGDFRSTGGDDGGDTDWLADGLGVELYVTARDAATPSLTMSGGVSRLPGTFAALDLTAVTLSASCPDEATGTLRLWDREGRWYTLLPGACDGLAEVQLDGTSLGSIPVDWSAWWAGADTPWD